MIIKYTKYDMTFKTFTNIHLTVAVDEASSIKKELDSGQTEIIKAEGKGTYKYTVVLCVLPLIYLSWSFEKFNDVHLTVVCSKGRR